jgi:protoporphyrinogen IX oxidase
MYLLLKSAHIAAVAVWFAGLFLLPQLLAAHSREGGDEDYFVPIGRRLYFHLMTPAAALAVLLGTALILFAQGGAWLPAKLALVGLALGLHVYTGLALFDASNGRRRHGVALFRLLAWLPLGLAVGILALTALKPLTLAPVDADTVLPAPAVPREPQD